MKTVLVTGTLGFIFSNFIRTVVKPYVPYRFVGVDKAVKQYNLNNMFSDPNYKFYLADIADTHTMDRIFDIEQPSFVIGGAAESFVDNAITNVMPFLHSNIIGTQTLIDMCLKYNVEKYIHISTDEVYGQKFAITDKPWKEEDIINARNPYAASKHAAEIIVKTAHETHGLRYQITRSCNVFGPRQKRENLIPHIISGLINNAPIRIHGSGLNFRQYIYVLDEITAIMMILEKGAINETYNIGAPNYFTNLEMVRNIASIMHKTHNITHIEDRKAHDFGYSIDSSKLLALGWKPEYSFKNALIKTVKWYSDEERL